MIETERRDIETPQTIVRETIERERERERERETGDWQAGRGLWAAEQGQQMGVRRERRGGSDLGLGESCVCRPSAANDAVWGKKLNI
jgi:hypothetical protein